MNSVRTQFQNLSFILLKKAYTQFAYKMGPQINISKADSVQLALNILSSGGVIALPTDTVYGLACSATNAQGINKLYEIKRRNENKPVAICVGKVEDVHLWADVSYLPDGLLQALFPGPVTLVLNCINKLDKSLSVNGKVGIRIPNYPFIINIANALQCPIALTSANLSNDHSSVKITEFKSLWHKLSAIFDGGTLGIGDSNRGASTVVDLSNEGTYFIMREGIACKKTELSKYSPRVLLGNWVEDRSNYVKPLSTYETTNQYFYKWIPSVDSSLKIVWNNTFRNEGYGREIAFDHDGLNYTDNFATTYDLSYNHLPKLFRTKPQILPKDGFKGKVDLTLNYGPVTSRGLQQIKRLEWQTQKPDPRVTTNSVTRDTFVVPQRESPHVIFNKKCHYAPGELGCNPITWQCSDEMISSNKSVLCSSKKHV